MEKYLELLKTIKEKGIYKPAAREGIPGTQSLFGYQFRHNLADGFPLLTTKKMFWKGVVIELLWFLKGDTNIKYLVDNGVNIWNEDAYNFYVKKCKEQKVEEPLTYEEFMYSLSNNLGYPQSRDISKIHFFIPKNYTLGDCGYQYGKVWRAWDSEPYVANFDMDVTTGKVDQIKNLIYGLTNNPESRRHIVTAIDPAHDNKLAPPDEKFYKALYDHGKELLFPITTKSGDGFVNYTGLNPNEGQIVTNEPWTPAAGFGSLKIDALNDYIIKHPNEFTFRK